MALLSINWIGVIAFLGSRTDNLRTIVVLFFYTIDCIFFYFCDGKLAKVSRLFILLFGGEVVLVLVMNSSSSNTSYFSESETEDIIVLTLERGLGCKRVDLLILSSILFTSCFFFPNLLFYRLAYALVVVLLDFFLF